MIYISITNFVRHIFQTRRLKNVVIFFQTMIGFVLWRKIKNFYKDLARNYENVTVKDFRKFEKPEYEKNKPKLDIEFLNSCKTLGVSSKFLIFKLPNVSNKDTPSIRKRLLRSAINNCNKELQHVLKELVYLKTLYLDSLLLLTSASLKNL